MVQPFIQKLPLDEQTSFVAQTFRTPNFEVGWHQHIECELILFTGGSGLAFIGNHIGEYEKGDIFFLGPNLPHTFQKGDPCSVCSAVVVQFRENFWGGAFLELPEARMLKELLSAARSGLKLKAALPDLLAPLILELEYASGFSRILILSQCLQRIMEIGDWETLSSGEFKEVRDPRLEIIFQYTIDHFREPVSIAHVAAAACMSVKNFCMFFKKSTKRTYIHFLNELRISYACGLLTDTMSSVRDIGYLSGYATLAHFHKQFKIHRRCSPLQYRKSFSPDVIKKGNNIGISA